MSVSPSQPFDWKKDQSQDPELREIIALIKGKKLYSRKIKKGDSNVTKALLRVKRQLKLVRFFWPGMHKQATLYVSKCQKCVKRKAVPDVAPLQPIIVSQPMELVHMDFCP